MCCQILIEIYNEHLPYEIDMLRSTYIHLTANPPPVGVVKDALIESFCVHARSLLDFFSVIFRVYFKSTSINDGFMIKNTTYTVLHLGNHI